MHTKSSPRARGANGAHKGGQAVAKLTLGAGVLVVFLLVQGVGYWRGAHSGPGSGALGLGGGLRHGSAPNGGGGGGLPLAADAGDEPAVGDPAKARALAGQGPAGHFSSSPYVGLMERELDGANATVGLCTADKPRLPGTPAHVCQQTYCLWSRVLRADVDLSFNILQPLPDAVHPEHCPVAQGGQLGPPPGTQPVVSFIFLAGSDDVLAAQTLLQLFRTAHEAPSAEFIVVQPAAAAASSSSSSSSNASSSNASGSGSLVAAMAVRLEAYFGTHVKLLTEAPPATAGGGEAGAAAGGGTAGRRRWAAAQQGLEAASGTYAVLVPPGTFVLRGWLYALLSTFEANPRAGALAPLVLERAKRVLEAGGLLHSDGTVSMLGAGALLAPPALDQLLHLRRVDFVSGALLALRREEALAAGGFDAELSYYFGDVDLSLSLQQRGLQVLVQPLSVVASRRRSYKAGEGAAAGAAAAGGKGAAGAGGAAAGGGSGPEEGAVLQQYLHDGKRLATKWATVLQQRYCPDPRHLPDAPRGPPLAPRRGAGPAGGPTVLWIEDNVPTPDKDSGSVRCLALMRILTQEGYRVSFLPRADADEAYNMAVRAAGVQVLPAANLQLSASPPAILGLQDKAGRCLFDGFVVGRRGNYNQTSALLDAACKGVPQIFDTVDLHFLREVRAELERRGLDHLSRPSDVVRWLRSAAPLLAKQHEEVAGLLRRKQNELDLIDKAQATLVVSDDEMQVIKHYLPEAAGKVHLVSNIHDVPAALEHAGAPCAARHGLLFVGNYNHKPNADAVAFLISHVLPRLRKKLPPGIATEVQTHLVGAGSLPEAVSALVNQNGRFVQFHGYLTDELLHMLYSSIKVAVAPLTTGAGVKGKVNQAMKFGVPVVATKIAVEGMHTRDGVDCLVAETAEEFADKVATLYSDCALWERLRQGGFLNLRQHFSTESARGPLLRALSKAGLPPPTLYDQVKCDMSYALPESSSDGSSSGSSAQGGGQTGAGGAAQAAAGAELGAGTAGAST